MNDLLSNKNPAISSPVRPQSQDIIGFNPNLFPFDAFAFDDPNKVLAPLLTLKEPWNFYFKEGVIIAYNGTGTIEEPNEGDSYISVTESGFIWYQIIDGVKTEMFKIGGTDYYGNLMKVIKTAGIMPLSYNTERPEVEPLSELLPFHDLTTMHFHTSSRLIDDITFATVLTSAGNTGLYYSGTQYFEENKKNPDYSGYVGYSWSISNNNSEGDVTNLSSTGATRVTDGFKFYATGSTLETIFSHGLPSYQGFDIKVSESEWDLVLRTNAQTYTLSSYNTGVDRSLNAAHDGMHDFIIDFDQQIFWNTKIVVTVIVDGILQVFDFYSVIPFGLNYYKIRVCNYLSTGGTRTTVADVFVQLYRNWSGSDPLWPPFFETGIATPYINHTKSQVPWSHYSSQRDILLYSQNGKVSIKGNTQVAGNLTISGTLSGPSVLTVVGPAGPQGPTGAEGPEGPEGPSYFDGGTWGTIYVNDQYIDGGSW